MLYNGGHKSLSELKNAKNVTVLNIKKNLIASMNKVSLAPSPGVPAFNNGMLSQALLYNNDGKRRLYVELWYEYVPSGNSVSWGSSHLYFSVLQELKKTFGGWRSNETDYYSNGTELHGTSSAYTGNNLYLFSGSFSPLQGVTGPIIYNIPSFLGECTSVTGTTRFTTGGVPNASTIYY